VVPGLVRITNMVFLGRRVGGWSAGGAGYEGGGV